MFARVSKRTDLAIQPTNAKATGNEDGVDVVQGLVRPLFRFARIGSDPANIDGHVVLKASRPQGLRDRAARLAAGLEG